MGVFDVLRYPISCPPTQDEMDSLPDDVFENWKHQVGWLPFRERRMIITFYNDNYYRIENIRSHVQVLKQILKDRDEHI